MLDLFNENILVEELTDDIKYNGVVTVYDTDSPTMYCKVIEISKKALEYYKENTDIEISNAVLIIKRFAKEEAHISGQYFISVKDIRGVMSIDEYNSLIA